MEKTIMVIAGTTGTFVSFLVDGLGEIITVLLAMMALDYISGLMAAGYLHEVNSRIGFRGLIRKAYYLLTVGAVYLMSYAVDGLQYASDGLAIAYIVMEFVSITENGTKMNLPMPEPVRKILLIVTDKIKGKEGAK